jgi:hypothetical protein
MADPLKIRRDQLAVVFKDQDTLRKIEKLFRQSDETSETVEAIEGSAQPVRHPENFANLDWIRLTENPKVADYPRILRWNEADHCHEYITGLGNIVQSGKEIWDIGVNKTGGTAADGKAVYGSGVLGNRMTFDYADARDGAKVSLIGVVTASIANNAEGPLTFYGAVRDLNTNAWNENDKLYIAADATGTLTSTPPAAPNFRIWIATVTKKHLTQGEIFVNPRIDFDDGVTIEDLHVRETLTSGDLTGGDYFELEDTGFEEAHGDARNWDDVYPSAVSVGRGASAPSDTTYLTGTNLDFKAPEFPSAAPAKEVTLHFQLYHSYDEGTDIIPHLHLYVPDDGTGGNIVFDYEFYWTNVSATGAPSTTTGSGSITRAASAGIASNQILSLVNPATGTGKLISSIFSITISRDTTDTFGSSVWLKSADCHIRKNTKGSRQEFVK